MLLSIESSCDDSSLAITDIASASLLYHKKISQDSAHSHYGGVVPEIASRLHAKALPNLLSTITKELHSNGISLSHIKAIALTTEPGLSVSLIEGLMMAKALCLSLRIPLLAINHLIGHFYSLFINQPRAIFPMSVLLVSGGHTQIIEAHDEDTFIIITQSLDDSFGESFDKVAKMLHLGYPGGPLIESCASTLPPHTKLIPLPLPLKDKIGFSFSGLKNATRLLIESFTTSSLSQSLKPTQPTHQKPISLNIPPTAHIPPSKHATSPTHITPKQQSKPASKSHQALMQASLQSSAHLHPLRASPPLSAINTALISASFQHAAIAHVANQVEKYFKRSSMIKDFAIVGGASSNAILRASIESLCQQYGRVLHLAPLEFCSDNAAMIGRAGLVQWRKKAFANIITQDISPHSTTPSLRMLTSL